MAIDTEERTTGSGGASGGSGNNKKVLIIVGVVLGVLVLLSIVGALVSTFVIKKGIEKTTGISVSDNGRGSVTIKGKDGSSFSAGDKKLPDGFPKDAVPLYKGAKIISTSKIAVDGKTNYAVALGTNDSQEQASKFYENAFPATNGWQNVGTISTGESTIMTFKNPGKKLNVIVSVGPNDRDNNGKTLIGLNVTDNVTE